MSLATFRKISPDNRPPKMQAHLQLISAANTSLKVVGVYNLKLSVNAKSIIHPIYVCDNLQQNAILGIDAIKHLGIVFDPSHNLFAFAADHSKWHKVADISPTVVAALHTAKAVTLPPLTAQNIELHTLRPTILRPHLTLLRR